MRAHNHVADAGSTCCLKRQHFKRMSQMVFMTCIFHMRRCTDTHAHACVRARTHTPTHTHTRTHFLARLLSVARKRTHKHPHTLLLSEFVADKKQRQVAIREQLTLNHKPSTLNFTPYTFSHLLNKLQRGDEDKSLFVSN